MRLDRRSALLVAAIVELGVDDDPLELERDRRETAPRLGRAPIELGAGLELLPAQLVLELAAVAQRTLAAIPG